MDDLAFLLLLVIFFIIAIFVLWLFFGGNEHTFEGLSFLDPPRRDPEDDDESFEEICNIEEVLDGPDNSKSSNAPKVEELIEESYCDSILDSRDSIPDDPKSSEIVRKGPKESQRSPLLSNGIEKDDMIPSVKVKLPSLEIDYYQNFILDSKNASGKHMDRKTASESKGEKACRNVLEKFFNKPFPTVRPDFLVNPESGRNLELDCYNAELGLALEYNGYQHYDWPNKFFNTKEEFDDQRSRDDYKADQCKKAGVYLMIVPYWVPHEKIPMYIEYYLPENVMYRLEHGIEEPFDCDVAPKSRGFPKNGFV